MLSSLNNISQLFEIKVTKNLILTCLVKEILNLPSNSHTICTTPPNSFLVPLQVLPNFSLFVFPKSMSSILQFYIY